MLNIVMLVIKIIVIVVLTILKVVIVVVRQVILFLCPAWKRGGRSLEPSSLIGNTDPCSQ